MYLVGIEGEIKFSRDNELLLEVQGPEPPVEFGDLISVAEDGEITSNEKPIAAAGFQSLQSLMVPVGIRDREALLLDHLGRVFTDVADKVFYRHVSISLILNLDYRLNKRTSEGVSSAGMT